MPILAGFSLNTAWFSSHLSNHFCSAMSWLMLGFSSSIVSTSSSTTILSDPAGVKTDSSSRFSGDLVLNLKLEDVDVDYASPGQYPSSSTTPMSESPSILLSFLYWLILGTRHEETQNGLQVRDRYNARLAKLLVLVRVLANFFLPQLTSLSSRALCCSSLRCSSVLCCHSLVGGLDARNKSLVGCCHSQWRSLFPGNYFKLSFFVRTLRVF